MYVYEFLWRGRPDGTSAYHVILAETSDVFGKVSHIESDALTPQRAEELGYPLSKIIAEINETALKERDAAIADKAVLEAERDAAIIELEKLKGNNGNKPSNPNR